MAKDLKLGLSDSSAACPTDEDIRLWESLSRDEQIEHFRGEIQASRDSGIGTLTHEQIKQEALKPKSDT